MGSSRYSPEGLQADEFPLDLRYRIDALYKLALSAYNAGNYEDTVHFVKKALDRNPSDLEILTLVDKVRLKDPKMDLSFFDKFREPMNQAKDAGAHMGPEGRAREATATNSSREGGPSASASTKETPLNAKEERPDIPQKFAENVPLGFLTHRNANLNPPLIKEQPPSVAVKVKGPIHTKVPIAPKDEPASPTKVLKPTPKAMATVSKNPVFKNQEISDLFNFDEEIPKSPPQAKSEPEKKDAQPHTSAGRRAKATEEVIKKLLSKKSLTEDRSELYKQVKKQLDEFKEEGYVVSRIEQMMIAKNPDMRKVLDDLVIISAQIDELRELKRNLEEASNQPNINKAKVFSIKLKLSDPDRVKEIRLELDQILRAANASQEPSRTLSPEAKTNIKNLMDLGNTALKQGNLQSAVRFFASVVEIDPTNLDARQELERLMSAMAIDKPPDTKKD